MYIQDSTAHFTGDFTSDLELARQEIGHNSDVYFREFHIGQTEIRAALIFVDGLSDTDLIDQHIIKSLMSDFSQECKQKQSPAKDNALKEYIKNNVLSVSKLKEVHNTKDFMSEVLTGSAALVMDPRQF